MTPQTSADDRLRDLRAHALLALLTGDDPAGQAKTVNEVYALRDLDAWDRGALTIALADLERDGHMTTAPNDDRTELVITFERGRKGAA